MNNRIRIAAASAASLVALSFAAPAQATVDTTRPCESVDDTNCTLTAVQVLQDDVEPEYVRSVNGGAFVPYTPENQLLRNLDKCRSAGNALYAERTSLFFEAQDLRSRVLVAESDAQRTHAELVVANHHLRHKSRTIARLRALLARR